jgi:hypothetical protein
MHLGTEANMKLKVEIDTEKFMDDLEQSVSTALERTGVDAVEQIRNSFSSTSPSAPGSPPAKVSGTLSDALDYSVDDGSLNIGIRSGSRAEVYAYAQEFGAIINPTSAEYLHFYIEGSDQWVKTKEVILPARPFLRPVINSGFVEQTFIAHLSDQMSQRGY